MSHLNHALMGVVSTAMAIGHLTKHQALNDIIQEYPHLVDWNIAVTGRFLAGQDRISNAFLVESGSKAAPVRKFVAKGPSPHAENSAGLAAEWRTLAMALESQVSAPALILPQHVPQGFLLIEFVPGFDAETHIGLNGASSPVFASIGRTLNQLHAVEAPYFGGPSDGERASWEALILARIEPRLASLKEILDAVLFESLAKGLEAALPAVKLEPPEPRLTHRDAYLSNFIVSEDLGTATVIDFGMACFWRPLFDLAKLYILDLYRYPAARDGFLDGYFGARKAPGSFEPLMRLYLYVELLGMLRFFRTQGQTVAFQHAVSVLRELTQNRGRIVDLLR